MTNTKNSTARNTQAALSDAWTEAMAFHVEHNTVAGQTTTIVWVANGHEDTDYATAHATVATETDAHGTWSVDLRSL